MYLVIAVHSTGHGPATSPVVITKRKTVALEAARGVEQLGYEFHDPEETYVLVSLMEEDDIYPDKFDDNSILLLRNKKNGVWTERWLTPKHVETTA